MLLQAPQLVPSPQSSVNFEEFLGGIAELSLQMLAIERGVGVKNLAKIYFSQDYFSASSGNGVEMLVLGPHHMLAEELMEAMVRRDEHVKDAEILAAQGLHDQVMAIEARPGLEGVPNRPLFLFGARRIDVAQQFLEAGNVAGEFEDEQPERRRAAERRRVAGGELQPQPGRGHVVRDFGGGAGNL
jgi:hypothetical protein